MIFRHPSLTVMLLIGTLGCASPAFAQQAAPAVTTTSPFVGTGPVNPNAPYNALILQQIHGMPSQGGYSASHQATQRLSAAASLDAGGLNIDPDQAMPSYCSGATYLVFLKTVSVLNRTGAMTLDERAMRALLINGQRDGEGIWGRWNANGPGTARLFHEMAIGKNFSDYGEALPGDFMKIFWSNAVGRKERGHSVIYLGEETVDGVESVRFWSSNLGVGYSEKVVPKKKISAVIFSRLTAPRNLTRAAQFQSTTDPYLGSLLSKESSLDEAHRQCGM